VVYAELSVRYDRIEDLEAMLEDAAIEFARTPREALSSPARSSRSTASRVAHEPESSRIFSLAPMPR
jgi:hypothetical protein